jgi:hypothetical protein
MRGNLEMVAALAVPVNGFESPQLALSASVEGGIQTLILPGMCDCDDFEELTAAMRTKGYLRRKKALMAAWR